MRFSVVVVVDPSINDPPASPFRALPFHTCRSLRERTSSDAPASQSIVRGECAHSLDYVKTTITSDLRGPSLGTWGYGFKRHGSSLYSEDLSCALVLGLNQLNGDAPWWPR